MVVELLETFQSVSVARWIDFVAVAGAVVGHFQWAEFGLDFVHLELVIAESWCCFGSQPVEMVRWEAHAWACG